MKEALLLIDIQNDYFEGGKAELHKPLEALENAERILKKFRQSSPPVIHVQHVSINEGVTFFLPDTQGVKLHERLAPLNNETLVIKHTPSGFYNTNLLEVIRDNAITELVVCGMMTHMCIDTTVRACKDHALKVTLLEDACATKDLKYRDTVIPAETVHSTFMAALSGMFASVMSTQEYLSK